MRTFQYQGKEWNVEANSSRKVGGKKSWQVTFTSQGLNLEKYYGEIGRDLEEISIDKLCSILEDAIKNNQKVEQNS